MAIREIRKEGDEILSKKCREVETIDDRIIELGFTISQNQELVKDNNQFVLKKGR